MKNVLKEKAVEMRKQGISIIKIGEQLGVAKSSISVWTRGVTLTDEQRHALNYRVSSDERAVAQSNTFRINCRKQLMDFFCKLCNRVMIFEKKIWDSLAGDAFKYRCPNCKQYRMLLKSGLEIIESETLEVGNFSVTFFPVQKRLRLVENFPIEVGQPMFNIIKNVYGINELTHELAVQWVKKLKTCVTFQ